MSLYNTVHGVNPATFFILPMLGKHPDEYPRFRDCFMEEREFKLVDDMPVMTPTQAGKSGVICVLTRVGGGNREDYAESIKELQSMNGYIADYDDPFDRTFATFVFTVPDRWKADYDAITGGNFLNISEGYRRELYRVFPKLKEKFDSLFCEDKS